MGGLLLQVNALCSSLAIDIAALEVECAAFAVQADVVNAVELANVGGVFNAVCIGVDKFNIDGFRKAENACRLGCTAVLLDV